LGNVKRSYEDPCGIARALDRIGERWSLLVVRELLLGPRRFTDLRAGLPRASPNVLSQRLDELEAAGVLQQRTLPPPAGATVYELTPWGAELEPAILALARWGSRALPVPKGELSASALMFAMRTTFSPELAGDLRARLAITLDDEPFALEIARKKLSLARGEPVDPDATITTDARALRAAVFLGERARLHVVGDEALARRVLTLFPRPTNR
jgi:DNA-binding HxlR family transcriptional regulator